MQAQRQIISSKTIWHIDPAHSTVEFSVRNFFFMTVKGKLNVIDGTIELDESDITRSSLEATLDPASINTGIKRRDEHLCSPAFLNVAAFPSIRFKSSRVGPGKDRDML